MTLARLLPDFAPARDQPAFRRLLAGGLLSTLGSSMTSFAVVLQLWGPAPVLTGRQCGPDGGLGRVRHPGLGPARAGLAALRASHGAGGAAGHRRAGPAHVHAAAGAARAAHRGHRPEHAVEPDRDAGRPGSRPCGPRAAMPAGPRALPQSSPRAAPRPAAALAWARPRLDCGSSAASRCSWPLSSPTSM